MQQTFCQQMYVCDQRVSALPPQFLSALVVCSVCKFPPHSRSHTHTHTNCFAIGGVEWNPIPLTQQTNKTEVIGCSLRKYVTRTRYTDHDGLRNGALSKTAWESTGEPIDRLQRCALHQQHLFSFLHRFGGR